MKAVKRILIGVGVLIALVLIIALFVRKDLTVEREIVINKPNGQVFNYIKYLKNQDNFSKWAKMDPNMKKDYRGTDGTVGFVSAWESKNDDVGTGEQEIKKIDEGRRLDTEIRFKEPFPSTAMAYMSTDAVASNQTKVKWGFQGKMSYPMNIMRLFMNMEDMLAEDLEVGLANLKTNLEKQP